MNIEYTSNKLNVVRCKNCWKQNTDNCPMEFYWDNHPFEEECYCAMGENSNSCNKKQSSSPKYINIDWIKYQRDLFRDAAIAHPGLVNDKTNAILEGINYLLNKWDKN